jgi:hypothetical protein
MINNLNLRIFIFSSFMFLLLNSSIILAETLAVVEQSGTVGFYDTQTHQKLGAPL